MEHTVKSTPKDVFLHLFSIVTFYLTVVGFITLYIQYINALFPDALSYYFSSIANSVRWASSILFVSVPAFITSAWLLAKDLKAAPEKRELKLRKWLVYFTLFVSAITIIIDLMVFVYHFLDGELTTRFFLKVLVVLLVAAAVFGYYIWDLKREKLNSKVPQVVAVILSVLALGSIIAGFFVVGTPQQQRNRKLDDQRIMHLQTLQSQVVSYWMNKDVLPKKIEDVQDSISGFIVPTDTETKKVYAYTVTAPLTFELCADFITSDKDFPAVGREAYYAAVPYDTFQQNWSHESGRVCFSRTIDPQLYKPEKGLTPVPAK